MATATETSSCKEDVGKLTQSFKNLAALSSDTKKPSSSRSESHNEKASDGSGSCTCIPFRSELMSPYYDTKLPCKETAAYSTAAGGIDMSQFILPVNEGSEVTDNEGSGVNYKPIYIPVGGEGLCTDMYESTEPNNNEGSKVKCRKTATNSPVSMIPMFRGPLERCNGDKRPSVFCRECHEEHPDYPYCPYVACDACGQDKHPTADCPYFNHIPQGAAFDSSKYEIVCSCGNIFNVAKWVCAFCLGNRPLLKAKYCAICCRVGHRSFECTKDEILAAGIKLYRDRVLGGEWTPYGEVCSV